MVFFGADFAVFLFAAAVGVPPMPIFLLPLAESYCFCRENYRGKCIDTNTIRSNTFFTISEFMGVVKKVYFCSIVLKM